MTVFDDLQQKARPVIYKDKNFEFIRLRPAVRVANKVVNYITWLPVTKVGI